MEDRPTGLPTDQEVNQSLADGQMQSDRETAELEDRYADAVYDEEEAQAELDAQLEGNVEGHTPEAKERNRENAHAKKYVKAQLSPVAFKALLVAGITALLAGLVGGPLIEFSMFFRATSAEFANEFGELSAAGRADATLFSLQAVALVIMIKLWAVRAKRMEPLIGLGFIAAVGFLAGAVIKHANAQIERAALSTNTGMSWNVLPGDALSNANLFGTDISAYLLSLGFLVMPIVSAALISWGWSQTIDALSGLHEARMCRRSYRARKAARRAQPAIKRTLEVNARKEESIVTAGANELVAEHMENARFEIARINKARSQTTGAEAKALDAQEAAARALIEKLGNGYVKDAYAKWQGDHRGSPP